MTIRHRDKAHQLLSFNVAVGRGASFCISDVMDEAQWVDAVVAGDGPLILGGALSGALEGLRRREATPVDVLPCSVAPFGTVMTVDDMETAGRWLSTGLLQEADSMLEQSLVTTELRHRGWAADPARVTSLVLAIAMVAGHAGDHDRG
ncbi:hypothetical protein [Microbacterium sp. NPDC055665]